MPDPFQDAKLLRFRDPATAARLASTLARVMSEVGRPVTMMHVCGSHEQAIARYGLRSTFPPDLDVIMGPGCPVCVTDAPEIDEGIALMAQGVHVATYGDMIRVPGTLKSMADGQAGGGHAHVVYSAEEAVELARSVPDQEVVFFATGFETTAVSTAAVILNDPPSNFSVLSAHKYVPAAMEVVARTPESRVEGFVAAGHAATITGWGIFEPMAAEHGLPIVVAGFEPLDILAAIVELAELIRDRRAAVVNCYPRCVTKQGNVKAQTLMWRVFELSSGMWRGICDIPGGNLRIRKEFASIDARRRFRIERATAKGPGRFAGSCICGRIMSGQARPTDCELFAKECGPERPIGACMVSSEGTCRIWHEYGGRPDLGA